MADTNKRNIAVVSTLSLVLITMMICLTSMGTQKASSNGDRSIHLLNKRRLLVDEQYDDDVDVLGHGDLFFNGEAIAEGINFNNGRRLLSEEIDVLGHGGEDIAVFDKHRLLIDDMDDNVLGHDGEDEITELGKRRRRLLSDDSEVLGHDGEEEEEDLPEVTNRRLLSDDVAVLGHGEEFIHGFD